MMHSEPPMPGLMWHECPACNGVLSQKCQHCYGTSGFWSGTISLGTNATTNHKKDGNYMLYQHRETGEIVKAISLSDPTNEQIETLKHWAEQADGEYMVCRRHANGRSYYLFEGQPGRGQILADKNSVVINRDNRLSSLVEDVFIDHYKAVMEENILDNFGESSVIHGMGDIINARRKQHQQWGTQDHDPLSYHAILMEEIGKVSKAVVEAKFNDGDLSTLRDELVSTAAVAWAMIQCLDRGDWVWEGSSGYLRPNLDLPDLPEYVSHYRKHNTDEVVEAMIVPDRYHHLDDQTQAWLTEAASKIDATWSRVKRGTIIIELGEESSKYDLMAYPDQSIVRLSNDRLMILNSASFEKNYSLLA